MYIRRMPSSSKTKPRVAVIGYGSQGRALALNLRDSGFPVVVGLRTRSRSRGKARREGIAEVTGIVAACESAEVTVLAVPDHRHREVFARHLRPVLKKHTALLFLHGLSVHFGLVQPPADCDVLLLAPHAPGVALRQKFEAGDRSISAFYAVHQNPSRHASALLFRIARGAGFKRKHLVKTTFENEAVGDLFGEQAVLCGGLAALIKSGFDTLVTNGLPAEHAYLEVAYQLDLIVELIKQHGIKGMFERISVAAQYGSLLTGPEVIGKQTRGRMQRAYDRVASGRFARKLDQLPERQLRELPRALEALTDARLEKAARKHSPRRKR